MHSSLQSVTFEYLSIGNGLRSDKVLLDPREHLKVLSYRFDICLKNKSRDLRYKIEGKLEESFADVFAY